MALVTPAKKELPSPPAWSRAAPSSATSTSSTATESEEHEHRRYHVRISNSKLTYRYSFHKHRRVVHRRAIAGSYKCSSCANRVADKWKALVLRMSDLGKDDGADPGAGSVVPSAGNSAGAPDPTLSASTRAVCVSDIVGANAENTPDKRAILERLGAAAASQTRHTPSQVISSWLQASRLTKLSRQRNLQRSRAVKWDPRETPKCSLDTAEDLIAAAGAAVAAVAVPPYAANLHNHENKKPIVSCFRDFPGFSRSESSSSIGTTLSFPGDEDGVSLSHVPFFAQESVEEVGDEAEDGPTSPPDTPQPIVESPIDTPIASPRASSLTSLVPVSASSPALPLPLPLLLSAPGVESKFEKTTTSKRFKIITDSYSRENSQTSNSAFRSVKSGNQTVEDSTQSKAAKSKTVESNGVTKEHFSGKRQDWRQLKSGDLSEQFARRSSATSSKIRSDLDGISQSRSSSSVSLQENKTVRVHGSLGEADLAQQVSRLAIGPAFHLSSSPASMASLGDLISSSGSPLATMDQSLFEELEKLKTLGEEAKSSDVEKTANIARKTTLACVTKLKATSCDFVSDIDDIVALLETMYKILSSVWSVLTHGHVIATSVCDCLRSSGGLDIIIDDCSSSEGSVRYHSAKLLEQCLTAENRRYLATHSNGRGLQKVVRAVAKNNFCPTQHDGLSIVSDDESHECWQSCDAEMDLDYSRVRTGILENLFKDSEATCGEVVKMGGLKVILEECRRMSDVEILRHCAAALTNLSLYGGPENQQVMIKHDVPTWLFPLAFHFDDNVKYYACLAIAAMVANKEIEADVIKSETLDLVEPFVTTHSPEEFANSTVSHSHGQSKSWLQRLVPVLLSKRKEARALAAFHFAMEAGIKKKRGQTQLFKEIKAVEALQRVASSPNAIASKYAAQALALIGEEVPHKLSLQVPLWTMEDVRQWVEQMGFPQYAQKFVESRVDGDLLLQLDDELLKHDVGISNGILRKKFLRELATLKKMADYSSCDLSNLNDFMQSLGPEFSQYTYQMLQAGVDRTLLKNITDDQLRFECFVNSSFHRMKILDAIRNLCTLVATSEENLDKNLDVFISYRRSNGSQLASLLKVHMQVRRFSAFLDVEKLEAGKFDNNLLQSIKHAKHFFLVLTPNALDRCIGDVERKDWVHKEICCALENNCNIIPILDNFQWPDTEQLPEDMKAVCYFNGVRWIHDYQDACVDKLVRFMNAETVPTSSSRTLAPRDGVVTPGTPSTCHGSMTSLVPGPGPQQRVTYRTYNRTQSNESGKGSSCSDDVVNSAANANASRKPAIFPAPAAAAASSSPFAAATTHVKPKPD